MNKTIHEGWLAFIEEAQNEIFPIYEKHEQHFDSWGIHGRMHISRALIFGEVMGRLYLGHNQPVNMDAVRLAAAFHDSGRQGNGTDLWEHVSAALCRNHLLQKKDEEYAAYVSNLIEKTGTNWDIQKRIVQDADVLEIMRPCCGHGGINGFQEHFFRFAGNRDPLAYLFEYPIVLRRQLIDEAWDFIRVTEGIKEKFENSSHYLRDLIAILGEDLDRYPLLSLVVDYDSKPVR